MSFIHLLSMKHRSQVLTSCVVMVNSDMEIKYKQLVEACITFHMNNESFFGYLYYCKRMK